MSAIDKDGNIVSLIQSNYSGFGSGLVPPKTGFMLQNRGSLFTLERGHPNALEPRKRPLHTIIPAFMEKDGVRIGFGIMGGWNQAQAHAQFVSKVVDFGMSVQAALETPRFTKQTFEGCDVTLESRIPESIRKELALLGHEVAGASALLWRSGRRTSSDARRQGRELRWVRSTQRRCRRSARTACLREEISGYGAQRKVEQDHDNRSNLS